MKQKQKKKRKKIRVKKNHIFVTLLLFAIMLTVLLGAIMLSIEAFAKIAIDTKLTEEVSRTCELADVYDSLEDKSTAEERLEIFGSEYFVTDSAGKVLLKYGESECDMEGYISYLSDSDGLSYRIYADSAENVLLPDDSDRMKLDYGHFLSLTADRMGEKGFASSLFSGTVPDGDTQVLLPLWISTKLKDSEDRIFVKCFVNMDMNDIVSFARFAFIMAATYCALFIVMLVYAISSILTQRRLTKMFFTDSVTGGRNRIWFLTKGDQLLRSPFKKRKTYAVYSLDIVKYLNFCICHSIAEGEKLICSVNKAVSSQLGRKALCVHYDSSDFAVLTEVADEAAMKETAEHILAAASLAADEYKTAFQLGAYMIGADTDGSGNFRRRKYIDLEECLNNAATARKTLETSDDSGIAYFDEKLVEEQRWISTVHDKQQAALDNEEFIVYYQPKYDPRTDKLRGAEALIRWQSPEFGFVTPYKFIPIFEKNGFITEIDHYMISHVAKDQKRWLDEGRECVPVSVNVSRAHFAEPDLAEQIRDIVDAAGTPHRLIEIELTESAFFDDKKALLRTIGKLKEYGFAVSMDDFGSGYSSLNSLKDMPLDVLKLDAEFFRGDNADEQRGRIVVAEAIKLARSLNMRTVAEGVEIKEQVDFLAEQKCDMIQGYYYAKPMPAEDYEKRMQTGQQT